SLLLRKSGRRHDMLPAFAGQGLEKLHEILLFFLRQFKRKDQRVLMWILHASLIVKIHDIIERFKAAVMHIGGRPADLPQGRGLERADLFRILGDQIASEIHLVVIPANADIVELFVGEVESRMALRAAGLVSEQEETPLRRW